MLRRLTEIGMSDVSFSMIRGQLPHEPLIRRPYIGLIVVCLPHRDREVVQTVRPESQITSIQAITIPGFLSIIGHNRLALE